LHATEAFSAILDTLMTYTFVPFTQEHLQPAVELFIQSYQREQVHNPCLPSRVMDEPTWIYTALQAQLANRGIAVIEHNRLLAYMVTGDQFPWKGQQAAIVPEYCHGAIETRKPELYQGMYLHLAHEWVSLDCHLHLIGHFAHDARLQEVFYQLGFGAIVAERLRDGSDIDTGYDLAISSEQDPGKFVDLHLEHIQYYPKSPIFILRSADRKEALADLQTHAARGDVFFVYYEQHQPCAYVIVGQSTSGGEGFLLQQTNSAQIKSAYTRPDCRGRGIGSALLQRAIQWSRQQGYERVFVEHETANLAGGSFWSRYFNPYLYFSMRYIDNRL
jgi:GNAT superfamily N-acetyltransferase